MKTLPPWLVHDHPSSVGATATIGGCRASLGEPVVENVPWLEPWTVFQELTRERHLLFFDSAWRHPTLGRYSYISAAPAKLLFLKGGVLQALSQDGVTWENVDGPWWAELDRELARFRLSPVAGLPPFQGGWAGLLSYDLAATLEHLPPRRTDLFQVPDLVLGLYDWVLAFDHVENRAWIIATGWPETDHARRQHRAGRTIADVRKHLDRPRPIGKMHGLLTRVGDRVEPGPRHPLPGSPHITSNFSPQTFQHAVTRAIEYIRAGDCFQVNLAQTLYHPRVDIYKLYAHLRERNPAPFAGYFDTGRFQIMSSSPERFLRCDPAGRVETRPIKGTRARGADPSADEQARLELLASAKDHAENVMIVDLLRNDLGRVCEYGSVQVTRVCGVESYPTVHHLVSVVEGQLRSQASPVSLMAAAFPGGSITGAPKVRAMEIIHELEPTPRGAYCGSLAWFGFNGAMDSSILIRTFTAGRGWLQFPVGGGIVADSQPEAEYAETLAKAAGLIRALE